MTRIKPYQQNHRRAYSPVGQHSPVTEQAMRNRELREKRRANLQRM